MPTLAILLALSAAAAWAIGMTSAKPGVRYMDVLTYTLARWSLVSVFAFGYGALTGHLSFPGWTAVGWAALAGVVDSAFGGVFYLLAMERTSAYQTTTLSSTAPLWGVFSAVLLLGEPLLWQTFASAALVIAGAALLARKSPDSHQRAGLGALYAVITGVLWGVSETVPAKLALNSGMTPETLLLVFALSGAVGMSVLLPLLRPRIPRRIERRGIFFVALSSIAGAFLGWLLWLHALNLAPASLISPLRGSTLLFAFLYSLLLLRERPSRSALAGIGLIFLGVLVVSLAG